MTRTLRLPESRRARVWISVLVAAALVLSVVFLVRWQRSDGKRADEIVDSLREMPGVASVKVAGDDDPLNLTVRMATDARRVELADVSDRVADLPDDLIDDVQLSMGAVTTAGGRRDRPSEDTIDMVWALRGLRHGTVELVGSAPRVRVETDKARAFDVAREVVSALDTRGLRRVELEVSGGNRTRTRISTSDDVSVSAAHAMLKEVEPVAAYLSDTSMWRSGIRLQLDADSSARMTTVASVAQRAARRLNAIDSIGNDKASFTVSSPGDGTSMTGDAGTDLAASRGVRSTLTKKGWTVSAIGADLSGIRVEKQGATAADLPRLRRDLNALQRSLPADAVVTLSDRDRVSVFAGTTTEMRRVTPSLVAFEKDHYRVFWDFGPVRTDISVLLPKGTALGPESIRKVGSRLREVGWSGDARIIIQEREKEGDKYIPPYVTFSSTAKGRASGARSLPRDSASVTADDATRAWDASATK